jgi:hypothetical protein
VPFLYLIEPLSLTSDLCSELSELSLKQDYLLGVSLLTILGIQNLSFKTIYEEVFLEEGFLMLSVGIG